MSMHVRDKLSSYNQVNHDMGLYSVNAPKPLKKTTSINNLRDTMESEAMKKDAFDKLNKTFIGNSVGAVIMKMAKYIFIAIAWPPYALVVELPKWIILQISPFMLMFTSAMKKTVMKQVKNFMQFTLPLVTFFQTLTKTLVQPVVTVAQGLQKLYNRMKSGATKIMETLRELSPKKLSLKKIQNMGVAIKNGVKKVAHKIKEPFVNLASKIKETLTETVKGIVNAEIVQKIVQMPQAVMTWMVMPMVQQFTVQLERAQKIADEATKMLSRVMSKMVAPFSAIGRLLYGPMTRVSTFMKSQLKKCFDFLKGKGQGFAGWAKSKAQALHPKNWIMKLFPPFLYSWIPLFIRNAIAKVFRWLMALSGTQALLTGMAKGWSSLLKLPSKFVLKCIDGVKSVYAHSKKIKSLAKAQFINLMSYVGYGINRTVYWSLTGTVMLTIIIGWSIQLLARVSIYLGRYVSRQVRA